MQGQADMISTIPSCVGYDHTSLNAITLIRQETKAASNCNWEVSVDFGDVVVPCCTGGSSKIHSGS